MKIGVISYTAGGIAYWVTTQIYIRYIGKEIIFGPLLSALLTIPFWPMHVYVDLRWIGVLPQDIVALLTVSVSVPLLLVRVRNL